MKAVWGILLTALVQVSFAQPVSVNGKVIRVGEAIVAGASIHVLNTNLGTTSDDRGQFTLSLLPGRYELLVTAIGYADLTKAFVVGSSGSDELVLVMTESVIQLDDIVVTAEKEEGHIQRLPYSISALSARKVNEYRIWNTREITAIVPNLYSANPGDNRNVTSIRGITSSSYDPAVATYIDGVNQFTLDTYIAQLFDVERIEVLRGPQGTLYGRNAMGGVINIITRQPTNQTRGFVQANLGSYGQQRYALGLRTPLIQDKLFLGVSGMAERNDGFYTNVFNDSDFDKKKSFTGNYFLTYILNPEWSFTANVKHQANRNKGSFALVFSPEEAFANPFEVNQNAITELVDNVFNSSLKVNRNGAGVSFTSLTTYQSNYRYYTDPIDADFSPLDMMTLVNNFGREWNNVKVWTQEFKFASSSTTSSPFKWTAGTYMFLQDNPTKVATHYGEYAKLLGAPDSLFTTTNTSVGKNKGIAFYGQATYSIGDKIDITAGLRYDYERKRQSALGQYQKDPAAENPVFDTRPDTTATTSYSAISPRVSAAYRFNDDGQLYASYSRGFRTGGLTQLSDDPGSPPLHEFKPEFSNNLEVGLKQSFADNRVVANLAAFYVTVQDAQVPTLVLPEAFTVTRNAGKLTSSGVELEISAAIAKGLQLDYNLGLTHARYKTLRLPSESGEVDLEGNRQIFTPEVTSMLALQYAYDLHTASSLRLVARAEWMYLGEQYFDLANNIKQSAYSLLNLRAGVSSASFEVMFWVRNLSDERYIAYAYDFGGTHLGDPMNWGVTLHKNFNFR
ncbi:MAG TPA: TonB-dependent receptor [Ohtaekwangia sp.]|nr:TonB-dependent receptor [Ohtaekwangia sp.]